jgi:mevalonate pyrophosphate decarboxylase
MEQYVFTASRLTRGNHLFPRRIQVTREHVACIKPRLIGTVEESISISQVASVSIRTGLIWSAIQIDSSGGSDPIVSHGHWKKDSRRIRDLIERFRQEASQEVISGRER